MTKTPITYGSYLRIPELLSIQRPVSDGPEHDEMLFIVIHQVYELWFKQQIHEGRRLREALMANDLSAAGGTVRRMLVILKTMVGQVDVLETMTPVQFLSFRSFLESASGFQSWQFRAFEILLGKRNPRVLAIQAEGSPERAELERAFREPTVWDAFLRMLAANGVAVPTQAVVERKLYDLPESVRTSALVDRNRKVASVVFALKDGMARAVPVRIGQSSLTDTIVLEGVAAGERVVVGPYKALDTLRDGMRVTEATANPEDGATIEARIGT